MMFEQRIKTFSCAALLIAALAMAGCGEQQRDDEMRDRSEGETIGTSGVRQTGPGTFESGTGMSTGTGLDGTGTGVGTTGDVDEDTTTIVPARELPEAPLRTEDGVRTGSGARKPFEVRDP